MKKLLIFTSCLLLAICSAEAQKPETAQVLIHYKFSHLRDTTHRDNPYKENMALLLGKTASVYKSYDRQLEDALFRKQMQEQIASSPDGNIKINRHNTGTNTQYFQFPEEKKLFRKERLFNPYLIEEPMPIIGWKISSDTASFGGLHCQKATAHFKGRDYTAWFCPDLPFHGGPWKLNGLPGVIVEAYDSKKDVVFKFDGVEDLSKMPKAAPQAAATEQQHPGVVIKMIGTEDDDADPNQIELPANAIRTNEKEFANLQAAMKKDPDAFVQSAMAASGNNLQGNNGPRPVIKIRVGEGPVINNPLELPEKK